MELRRKTGKCKFMQFNEDKDTIDLDNLYCISYVIEWYFKMCDVLLYSGRLPYLLEYDHNSHP